MSKKIDYKKKLGQKQANKVVNLHPKQEESKPPEAIPLSSLPDGAFKMAVYAIFEKKGLYADMFLVFPFLEKGLEHQFIKFHFKRLALSNIIDPKMVPPSGIIPQ